MPGPSLSRAVDAVLSGLIMVLTAGIVLFAALFVAVAVSGNGANAPQPAVGWPASTVSTPAVPVRDAYRSNGVRWLKIGESVERRPILAATFGAGPRRILFVGGVHGSEYGASVTEQFADSLAADPSSVPPGTEVDVIGCLNPDGRARDTRGNARGVDLNRNLPAASWTAGSDRGISAGPRPASEPETQVLLSYLKRRYIRVISLHSAGGLVDYDGPGGRSLAIRIAQASGMPVRHLARDHFYTGTLGQYAPERYGIPVITIEVSERALTHDMYAGLTAAMR